MSDTPLTARDDDYTARLIARATHVAGNHLMIGYNGFTPYFRQGAEPVRLRSRRQEGRGDRRVHPRHRCARRA